jgi:sugar lactone lactonase YvrE
LITSSTPQIFDTTLNQLGEGPLWHPLRQELFWFDILSHRLFSRAQNNQQQWQFDEPVSAAGWIDEETLLIASASNLLKFDIVSGHSEIVIPLESDNAVTRSNDGRADPYGGFWIGTMGRKAEPNAGAIYRYYRGELRRLYKNITISNAICFSPGGDYACFADTTEGKVMRQKLDRTSGWPEGAPEPYLDLSVGKFGIDGAVIDCRGNFWNAQWGASRLACYDQSGSLIHEIPLPTPHITCPAFGGIKLSTLFVTTARQDLSEEELRIGSFAGQTFLVETSVYGQEENRVIL